MFNFFKNKPDNESEKQKIEYYQNIKDNSLFLDKAILTFSSLFLWFLFTQLEKILKLENSLKKEIINEYLLIISVVSIWITIFLVLLSYISSIQQAKVWYKILDWEIDYDEWMKKFNNWDKIIDILRYSYFLTFIIPIIATIIFYITNLQKYVW